ncbi:MAG: tryptophan synthase subunit alpha [Methanomassiliicoccaceae archaeon]|nr:tryptophan synthase subunit alpha [Methanomassiliicoccaceae archaeon]MCL2145712.1 tryptophan synthase subunit alpha [Methanomassiliicoccaceae archaeon]
MLRPLPDTKGGVCTSNISKAFADKRSAGKKAFVAYIMGGDPDPDMTKEYILAMEQAGADIIEIGIPFSDPIAEGEVIQRANLRALASATDIDKLFETLRPLKGVVKVPLLFMTYLNPVFRYGYDRFFERCGRCGISGVIVPDMPFEEQGELLPFAEKHRIDIITLIAPTSQVRIEQAAKGAGGFIYLVSSLGVTGMRSSIRTDIGKIVAEIRRHTDVPIAVGFGIHSPEQAASLSEQADGIIVGSAIVRLVEEHGRDAGSVIADYIRNMKKAME